MKRTFDSYCLYSISQFSTYVIRNRFTMKDEVDENALRRAVNIATRRYPYFMVKLSYAEDGSYIFEPNDSDIVVIRSGKKNPDLCTEQVNNHLLYVDYEGRDIYFNFSHALAGGKGVTPWLMTCVYQYVVEKYNVLPNAPAIRKPDSAMFPDENAVAKYEQFEDAVLYQNSKLQQNRASLVKDYINGLFNPFKKSHEYYIFEFKQEDIINLVKGSDNSVNSFFDILMFQTMCKVLPDKGDIIIAETAHNPVADLGIPNTRNNYLSHVLIPYSRQMADWDIEKLGTLTRGAIILQSDSMYSLYECKRQYRFDEEIDKVNGKAAKQKYAKKNSLSLGKDATHGTFIVNYTGYMDWGELADYIESYVHIVDGHQLLEISALGDRIFCCYHQVIRTDKYINAFQDILRQHNIEYKIKGPFKKNLCKHKLD